MNFAVSVLVLLVVPNFVDCGHCFKRKCVVNGVEGCKSLKKGKFESGDDCCKSADSGSFPHGYYETMQPIAIGCFHCHSCLEILNIVNGTWSEWSDWTECSKPCEKGIQERKRTCDDPPPSALGKDCDGLERIERFCNEHRCPIDGGWSHWSKWSHCSTTCGLGTKIRYRRCNNPAPQFNGRNCRGSPRENQQCSEIANCPVDGKWSSWSEWSDCSKTCGTGVNIRRRLCNNPSPKHNGKLCEGDDEEQKHCYRIRCPIHGRWTAWSEWSNCLAYNCDDLQKGGYQIRSRSCSNPQPQFRGSICKGPFFERFHCVDIDNCAINGGWGSWSEWNCDTCDAPLRNRECNNPSPAYGGEKCPGSEVQVITDKPKKSQICPRCLYDIIIDGLNPGPDESNQGPDEITDEPGSGSSPGGTEDPNYADLENSREGTTYDSSQY